MSQWKLPIIDSKKSFGEQQEYNFVNKDKKKTKQNGALSMIQELKHKIQQQRKQIQNRNATIMGLQRNFQSLSVIVKNQKAQSATLKAQLQNLRENSEIGDKRATQFHQKCILLQNQNKIMKQQLNTTKKLHSQCYKILSQSQMYKNKVSEMLFGMQKLQNKLQAINQQKKILQKELIRYKGEEKVKRQMQERIIDLEEQLKNNIDINNILNDKIKLQDDQLHSAKSDCMASQAKLNECFKKFRQDENKIRVIENECDYLKKQLKSKQKHSEQLKKNIDSLGVYSKVRQQQDDKYKEQLKLLKTQCESYRHQKQNLSENLNNLTIENNKRGEIIKIFEKEIKLLREQNSKLKQLFCAKESKEDELIKFTYSINQHLDQTFNFNHSGKSQSTNHNKNQKLEELKQQLLNMNQKILKIKKYSQHIKSIDQNQPKGLIITNKEQLQKVQKHSSDLSDKFNNSVAENKKNLEVLNQENLNMRKYINSLQTEVNIKTKQNHQKDKIISQIQQQLQTLKGEQRKLAETISQQRSKLQQFKKQSQQFKQKSQKQKQQQRIKSSKQKQQQRLQSQKKIDQQKKRSNKFKQMLQQYQQQQQKLKKLMQQQQQNIKNFTKIKQQQINQIIKQKQKQVQKQRKNNKLLWTDNKKLKDMEQKLKQQTDQQLHQIQKQKYQQILKLKHQLSKKYQQQLNIQKQQQSNSTQLKKILHEKAQQIKIITQNYNKIKNQLQFYKNRNKQLQGVLTRTQKNYKDQLLALQKQLKLTKQTISTLDKKNIELTLIKQQNQKKYKIDLDRINQQINYLKLKYQGQKIQQKIILLQNTMNQFQNALVAICNTLSCNYCLQPIKQCIRLKQCGHIYCKKCKPGYQPNCGQCKRSSQEITDKMIDNTVSKSEYMKILINTVKEDLSKISL